MKLLLVFVLAYGFVPSIARAQGGRPLVIRHDTVSNVTDVSTEPLRVIDQPEQFLQIQFSGAYASKDLPTAVPFRLNISFFSYSTKARYRQHSASKLVAYADDERIPIGLGVYDSGYSQLTMTSGTPVSQPATFRMIGRLVPVDTNIARVLPLKDIVSEFISVEAVSFDSLVRLANSRHAELQLGSTRFALNELAHDALRLFSKALTPPGYKPGVGPDEAASSANSPSEANNTPFDQTMTWLKSRLSSLASRKGVGKPTEFDGKAFLKCQFKYSEFLGMYTSTPVGLGRVERSLITQEKKFSVNFADLDPDAVYVTETPSVMILRYVANDSELRIKEESYEDSSHYRGSDIHLRQTEDVWMKKDGKRSELRDAFIHAIKLCQANPTK